MYEENVTDGITYKPLWTIYKFPKEIDQSKLIERSKALTEQGLGIDDMKKLGYDPYAVEQIPFNSSLKLGRNVVCNILAKTAVITRWTSNAAWLFVGTHSTAASYTQSKLLATSGTSSARYKMDSGYPTVSSNVMTWRSTFTSATANFAWKEYSLRNASKMAAGKALNRVSLSKGTKASGETWTLQLQITVT